jgi:hypothetical protein
LDFFALNEKWEIVFEWVLMTYVHRIAQAAHRFQDQGFMKVKIFEWAGHLIRASANRMIKKVFNTKPEGSRKLGRPGLRRKNLCDRT